MSHHFQLLMLKSEICFDDFRFSFSSSSMYFLELILSVFPLLTPSDGLLIFHMFVATWQALLDLIDSIMSEFLSFIALELSVDVLMKLQSGLNSDFLVIIVVWVNQPEFLPREFLSRVPLGVLGLAMVLSW
ncbi:hypothetical protein WN944_021724 [Citrus x changshan-huyou]|uniref:Uncharacterized protein n=1 Tax=Citrus x changshan-huyou TaxID=2935761 RepID=A0AAP0MXD2_9ROSI